MATPGLSAVELHKIMTKSATVTLAEELKRAYPHPDCITLIENFGRDVIMELAIRTRIKNN